MDTSMSTLIRLRYNTMADESPGGEWRWRVIMERDGGYEEVLVKELSINVPSFSQADEMPVVGRKYHIACHGTLTVKDGLGTAIDAACDIEITLDRDSMTVTLIEGAKAGIRWQSSRSSPPVQISIASFRFLGNFLALGGEALKSIQFRLKSTHEKRLTHW
ncbi:hypothetical protein A5906_30700 [Bradyrhizobium sacchari]|uniref:Uncharacterized protein n=1 Tax=Bradyrhizobium sacchari TaxID=1399419 RepID=A0A560JRL1_9BRAD|nr:hypothetical protein [Bradyrhizobium sacchari]OPY98929.1 hypothetical protein A5906_30700 [Bradyrhizobium sacchari]TWB60412.1 hypothetical protein FBZ94_104637 [Bradyrhizobium sacchari]TWB73778.1 hypothetical protein FBZ95_10528 [Bradyrhizobium sacchari]